MRSTRRRSGWKLLTVLAASVFVWSLAGCGSSGTSGTDSLAGATRTAATMDGFVFVPSRARQVSAGDTSIPHALIEVWRLPLAEQTGPLVSTQADANGYYQLDFTNDPDQVLNRGLLVVATDPFDPQRVLRAVISFQDNDDDKNRNLTPTSTIAASMVLSEGWTGPLTDAQISALETLAETILSGLSPGADPTLDPEVLQAAANAALAGSLGGLELTVHSTPPAAVTVRLNGEVVGTITSAEPESEAGGATVTLPRLFLGTVRLTLTAAGFVTDEFAADVLGGQTVTLDRTLVPLPTGGNQPPVVVTSRLTPQTLPFQGGQVQILAVVRDPEGDPVNGSYSVQRTADEGGSTEIFGSGPLARNGDLFTALLTVPGNAQRFNQTYTVTMSFTVGSGGLTVRRVREFQVSGVVQPPQPPTDAPDSSARGVAGDWLEVASGSSESVLQPSSHRSLMIGSDATILLVTPQGQVRGRLRILGPIEAAAGLGYAAELGVSSSSDSDWTVGEVVPLQLVPSSDGDTLMITIRPGTDGQEVVRLVRAEDAAA